MIIARLRSSAIGMAYIRIQRKKRLECIKQPVSLPSHLATMSFGRAYQCPLERPLGTIRQRWGDSSGGSGYFAAALPQSSGGEQRSGIGMGSRRRSRSPRRHRGYTSALAVGPSARFQAQRPRLHKPPSRAQLAARPCYASDTSTGLIGTTTSRDTDN